MEDGAFYDLEPPSKTNGKVFRRVQCEYQVPNNVQEYVVRGIPEGHTDVETFVLRFTDRGMSVTPSPENGFTDSISDAALADLGAQILKGIDVHSKK